MIKMWVLRMVVLTYSNEDDIMVLWMTVLTCSDEDDNTTDPVNGVHDSLLAVFVVSLTYTTDDLNCRRDQNDDTEDCVNLSAL